MDALQSDIDALENEKTDLKKKLEIYSKKSKLDFGTLSQTSAAMSGIVGTLALRSIHCFDWKIHRATILFFRISFTIIVL